MKRILVLLSLFFASVAPLYAQDDGPIDDMGDEGDPAAAVPANTVRLVEVDDAKLANLDAVLPPRGAISLTASEQAFQANTAAQDALFSWVSAGNVVFLHNGIADEFGFQTVEARPGSNQQAGELYGRAHAALPFGLHPLLWDDGRPSPSRRSDPSRLPGVNLVFYQMQPGDCLVSGGDAATPLLEVSDLSTNGNNRPLYAAAIAPCGQGWAIFCPDEVDQKRADGALFARNLLSFVPQARSAGRWVAIPSDAIASGAPAVANAIQASMAPPAPREAPALPNLGTTPPVGPPPPIEVPMGPVPDENANAQVVPPADDPDADPDGDPANDPGMVPDNGGVDPGNVDPNAGGNTAPFELPKVPALILSRTEAAALLPLLGEGNGALNLLKARYALQAGDLNTAGPLLDAVGNDPVLSSEASYLSGCINAENANDVTAASPLRARSASAAASDFADSVQGALPPTVNGESTGVISAPQRQAWAQFFNGLAGMFNAEPPLALTVGRGNATITIRCFADDPSVPLLQEAVTALANADSFGWRTDREEVLIFPSPELYALYRRGAGLTTQNVPLPAGSVGDVTGQRIVMITMLTNPLIRINPVTKKPQILPRTGGLSVVARLQAYALLNVWLDGSTGVPGWLALGLENLADQAIGGNPDAVNDNALLLRVAQNGGLLTPQQFAANPNTDNRIPAAQASAILAYLYAGAGAGSVTEVVQRLGAGEDIDTALEAVTDGGEADLFTSWRRAQFGPQPFPNRG